MNKINQNLGLSCRDNMLVENKIFSIYHRPVRDGMWEKGKQLSLSSESDAKRSGIVTLYLFCQNQDLQNYKMNRIKRIGQKSPKDFNMDNPLQAERSWGYKITTTLLELRSSSTYYHINHLNHGSDNKDESMKGRKSEGKKQQAETCSLIHLSTNEQSYQAFKSQFRQQGRKEQNASRNSYIIKEIKNI